MARAASKTLGLANAEPQYASKLCWAAANVLAVNTFYHCPASPSTTSPPPPLFPTSQGLLAGYHAWHYSGLRPDTLSWFLSNCQGNIQDCNDWDIPLHDWDIPHQHGLTFNWGKDPKGLKWETITQEIEAGHPVLIVWDYPENGTDESSPVGLHELVIIGYSDDTGTQQLQIWDPWPVPDPPPSQVPACGPASGVQVTQDQSQPIDFSTYSDPVSDMGVTAVHAQDQWGLAMAPPSALAPNPLVSGRAVRVAYGATPPPPPTPAPFRKLPHPPSRAPEQVSFAKALGTALPLARKLVQVPGAAPRSLGVPFPIVGLGFKQLLGSDDPTRLLAGTTSAILFPVESQGEVVDAFLMLFSEGRWQRGGYANRGITRRLVDVRARYATQEQVPLNSFYMVSVPGEVAFFAAYGKGKQAVFIPASTDPDPTIDTVAGKAVLADKQLRKLITAIRIDLDRQVGRSRDTGPPRQ
jgi:hypothetical protein